VADLKTPAPPKRMRFRVVSAGVLVGLAALAVSGCLVTRHVVADQEHRLLQQRTEEAGLYLGSVISSVQTQLSALWSSAVTSSEPRAVFEHSGQLVTTAPGGFSTVALVRTGTAPVVVAVAGQPIGASLTGTRANAVAAAVAAAGGTGAMVSTPLFGGTPTARMLGFAYAGPGLPGYAVYGENVVKPSASTPATSGQPFSEIVAAIYAGGQVRADQLLAASAAVRDLPLRGQVATTSTKIGAGKPWLLVAKARHPLVGSVATAMPWAILAAGLLTALLAALVVETLARRREYAMSLVRVRTGELEHSLTELADAHDQLVRSERLAAIGQLASTIGHELRNPLAVLSNSMFLLRGDFGPAPSEQAQRHLSTAEREISAATVIVSDLLEFARQREPVRADVDIVGLVDEVLHVVPAPGDVEVAREFPSTSVVANVDRDMMRQVLLNLVGNAYQAMPDGGTLGVGVSATDGAVQVRVRDTGTGMTADVRARLFEPFFTTKPRGVGLGLAVAKRVVDAHGGAIAIDSAPDLGTEFCITLPVISPQRPAAEADRLHEGAR
jgi:signal transduction histidine kinase